MYVNLLDRIVIPSVLLTSLVFNIVFFMRSKVRGQTIRPDVVHEPQAVSLDVVGMSVAPWRAWAQQRYNKALMTNAGLPVICLFLATGLWITVMLAQKFKGKTNKKTSLKI